MKYWYDAAANYVTEEVSNAEDCLSEICNELNGTFDGELFADNFSNEDLEGLIERLEIYLRTAKAFIKKNKICSNDTYDEDIKTYRLAHDEYYRNNNEEDD